MKTTLTLTELQRMRFIKTYKMLSGFLFRGDRSLEFKRLINLQRQKKCHN